jgi:hypothetical protein
MKLKSQFNQPVNYIKKIPGVLSIIKKLFKILLKSRHLYREIEHTYNLMQGCSSIIIGIQRFAKQ